MLTSLLKAVGGSVKKGRGTREVALVLNNSGSMAGQPLADLCVAAKNLTSVLFAGYEGTDKVRLAIVPFAGAVNVGAAQPGAARIDSGGLSPVHYENFAEQRPRFHLFTELGVRWGGCVEVRPSPHDVTDSVPQSAVPASLFVPMVAPDEPDPGNAEGHSHNNNYLSDTGGRCLAPAPTCVHMSRRGRCTAWSTPAIPAAAAQARTCKYDGGSIGSGPGPNALCDTQPILPLTENKSAVDAAIGQMRAKGSSNILEGLMWGWRVRVANRNRSIYHAFGYATNGSLGNTATTSTLISQLNNKTTACENTKAAGITVYTIAFRLEGDVNTRALLASCASSAAEAYRASDGATLAQALEAIAREIAKLRIAS